MRIARPALAVLVVAVFFVAAWPAAAAEPYRAVKGAPGPGPSQYDKVYVQRFGSSKAKRVLVLVPGFLGGAGDFRLIARDIVRRVKGCRCGHRSPAAGVRGHVGVRDR